MWNNSSLITVLTVKPAAAAQPGTPAAAVKKPQVGTSRAHRPWPTPAWDSSRLLVVHADTCQALLEPAAASAASTCCSPARWGLCIDGCSRINCKALSPQMRIQLHSEPAPAGLPDRVVTAVAAWQQYLYHKSITAAASSSGECMRSRARIVLLLIHSNSNSDPILPGWPGHPGPFSGAGRHLREMTAIDCVAAGSTTPTAHH